MTVSINRRDLGKGSIASALIAAIDARGGQEAVAQIGRSQGRWQSIAPGVWKTTVGLPETVTPVSSRIVQPMLTAMQDMPIVTDPALGVPLATVSRRGTTVAFPLMAHEEIYGFGLQFFGVAQRGKKRVIRVNADPRGDTGDSHAPVPFYVSTHGYGVLIDTARYAVFYCGNARSKPMERAGETENGTAPLYTRSLGEDDVSQIVVEVPIAQGVDVYFFAGPTMLDVVRRYNLFSGGGVLPPEWGLGFWYRTSSNATAIEIAAIAKEFRERNIPCDVLGLEPGWQTHTYSCTFAWNKTRFPQPASFIKDMKAENYHVNLWEHAFTHPSSPLFEDMRNLAGDKGVWGGLVPDFQNPVARRVFGDYHGQQLIDLGISGFKLDECDNSDFTGGWSFPELSKFPSGIDGEQMHSLFGLRYQQTLWEQFLKRKQATYSLVRSSGALASPYPFVLYSDLYDHRQFVCALVNSGFSGLLWCPEVRDAKSEEDLLRRLQTVVFSPLAMINGWYINNPPWKQLDRKKNNANDLLPHWEVLEEHCREIIGWRMQLIPYLRAAFARYAVDGTPPFRALALDWPAIAALSKVDDVWMVGDRMLVAPLFAGEAGRKLTLPPGAWHNFWTGEVVKGGIEIYIPAETKEIPVYVKAGSVIPLAAVTNSTADKTSRELRVKIFGDGSLPFELKTAETHLLLSWSSEGIGTVQQSGNDRFTVLGWTKASG